MILAQRILEKQECVIFRWREWIELERGWTNSWVPWEAQYSTSHEITSWTDRLLYGLMNDDGQMEQPKRHRTADYAASPHIHRGGLRDFIPPFPPSSNPMSLTSPYSHHRSWYQNAEHCRKLTRINMGRGCKYSYTIKCMLEKTWAISTRPLFLLIRLVNLHANHTLHFGALYLQSYYLGFQQTKAAHSDYCMYVCMKRTNITQSY